MRINLNGQDKEIATETTVAALVGSCDLNPKHVAVEVNCELVPRRTFPDTLLKEGDQVEIVTLVGGG